MNKITNASKEGWTYRLTMAPACTMNCSLFSFLPLGKMKFSYKFLCLSLECFVHGGRPGVVGLLG